MNISYNEYFSNKYKNFFSKNFSVCYIFRILVNWVTIFSFLKISTFEETLGRSQHVLY